MEKYANAINGEVQTEKDWIDEIREEEYHVHEHSEEITPEEYFDYLKENDLLILV